MMFSCATLRDDAANPNRAFQENTNGSFLDNFVSDQQAILSGSLSRAGHSSHRLDAGVRFVDLIQEIIGGECKRIAQEQNNGSGWIGIGEAVWPAKQAVAFGGLFQRQMKGLELDALGPSRQPEAHGGLAFNLPVATRNRHPRTADQAASLQAIRQNLHHLARGALVMRREEKEGQVR